MFIILETNYLIVVSLQSDMHISTAGKNEEIIKILNFKPLRVTWNYAYSPFKYVVASFYLCN